MIQKSLGASPEKGLSYPERAAGVAQGPLFLAGSLDAPLDATTRTRSFWAAGRGIQRLATPVFPANFTELEQAWMEVETSP